MKSSYSNLKYVHICIKDTTKYSKYYAHIPKYLQLPQ